MNIDNDHPDQCLEQRSTAVERLAPVARDLPAAEVVAFLRSLVGLVPANDESAVDASRPAPRTVDAKAWIAWVLGGLYACALPPATEGEEIDGAEPSRPWVPRVRVMVAEARRVALVIAMHRHAGNLSHASKALGTSRRALREALKRAEIYPWKAASEDGANATTTDATNGGE